MRERFCLHVELETDAVQSSEIEAPQVFLFRAVQELLLNVVKQAGVTRACVFFSRSDDRPTVSDHGKGFDSRRPVSRTS
jgi:signal transduction histidine kinase